ncbi:MAG: hypothetical protein LBC09_03470, partial [Helicobacteraceae bacterium]|nr:hypothetical protein [Helicobacteraceae bacterium]
MKTTILLAREGFLSVFVLATLALVSYAADCEFLAAVFTIATLYALWFFRNLERIPDERDRLVFIAPIDG